MASEVIVDKVAKEIAGDITWSDFPGKSMRKWREIFGVTQLVISKRMGISSSVLSDYEKGRRTPGSGFVKKFVRTLLEIDRERGYVIVKELARGQKLPPSALLDMREFPQKVLLKEVVEAVKGIVLYGSEKLDKQIYGYTVLDSIAAIESMTGQEFLSIMGLTTERVLVFTNVGTGRSPMVAVRVSFLKPGAVVVHGPKAVDPLAVKLAESDGIPFILSQVPDVQSLLNGLRGLLRKKENQ
ncbi:MAG: helix-turn-helix domain-containing protein [Fervidicoccaceae archaeon]|jgi:putative transcriptional regulator